MKQLQHPGNNRIVSAGENRQSDDLYVLLQRGIHNHLGSLAKAGVNDLHAGIAESASDYFRSPVVAIQTGFGDQHPNFFFGWHFPVQTNAAACKANALGYNRNANRAESAVATPSLHPDFATNTSRRC